MALHLTSCEIFVILEQKRNPHDSNKNKVKKKTFQKIHYFDGSFSFIYTAPPTPTSTHYYSTFLIHWMCKTFNFPATTEAGPGGKRGGEERSAAALNWFCYEGPMCSLAGVAEPQSGAITPAV